MLQLSADGGQWRPVTNRNYRIGKWRTKSPRCKFSPHSSFSGRAISAAPVTAQCKHREITACWAGALR